MKKISLAVFACLLFVSMTIQAQQVERFDGTWTKLEDAWSSEGSALKQFTYDSTLKYEGAASLKIEWLNKTFVDWQYAGVSIAQYTSPLAGAIDLSGYDSLVFYMYVDQPATSNDTYLALIFRENPSDVSYAQDPTGNNGKTEFWRHQYNGIFTDNSKTWKRISVPLKIVGDPKNPKVSDWNAGWNRQNAGTRINNESIDWNAIRGFYMEFDSDSTATYDSCVVYFDNMMLVGHQVSPLVLFNGRFIAPGVSMATGWSGSVTIDPKEDYDNLGTGAVKWTADDGWDGVWWDIKSPKNLGPNWTSDTIQFAIKAPAGLGKLYVALADNDLDGEGTADRSYQVVYEMSEASVGGFDGNWKLIRIPLKNFAQWGSWDQLRDKSKWMDSSMVAQVRIEGGGQAMAGKVVYFDNVWTGTQKFDIAAPSAPKNVSGAKNGNYVNTISWDYDVTGKNPAYNIYASTNPITDVHGQGVIPIAIGVTKQEGSLTGIFDTRIVAPKKDASLTSYYAVTSMDFMGVESDPGKSTAVVNTAKGLNVIHASAPANFVVNGNLGEWTGIAPFRMNPKDGSGNVVQNTVITDSADLNVKAYIAVDNANLYVAFDVTDDSVVTNNGDWPGHDFDSPELYIGLYDGASIAHFAAPYARGTAPEYKLRFSPNQIFADDPVWGTVMDTTANAADYVWKKKTFTSGYTIEARIPFATLAQFGGDSVFHPIGGMKLPIDFHVNDRDITLGDDMREGLMTYAIHGDNLWDGPAQWTYTWIDGPTLDVSSDDLVATSFSLSQNYPNPFNPTTKIKYSIDRSSVVSLKVYDIIGREVATVVNEYQNAGNYTATFNPSNNGKSLASGVYFYTLTAGSFRDVKKMTFIK
ncbi:MAG: T9SS type A sorting domain-containing protein [Bacteroidetes bacterium]|nr:T9SS type A sorting domain-containing protein [Bacteroidota bacterium]